MTAEIVYQRPFYADTNGSPLDSGKLYVGAANQDPELFPLDCFWDSALTLSADQPIDISAGYIIHNGARAAVYTAASVYSQRIRNKADTQVDYIAATYSPVQTGTVRAYGALGDGTTDDRAAFEAADAEGAFTIPTGTYKIGSNITIANAVQFEPGASLVVPNGVTVTFASQVAAQPVQIFACTGSGAVSFDTKAQPEGWAEWWGLTPSSAGAASANLASINAALASLRETRLLAQTYYTSGTMYLNIAGHILRGSGHQYDGVNEGRATRILCTSATAHILYMGALSFSTVAALPRGIEVHDIYLDRSTAPNVTSGCVGLYNKYSQFSRIQNVKTNNSVYGFQFSGTVQTKADDMHAFRDTAGTGGTDIFYGFYIEGATAIGLNGSNASLYLSRPVAEMGITISNSVGIYADHKMTDMFLFQPETSGCTTGIEIYGDASNSSLNQDNTDIQIIAPILDTFAFAGLYIHGLNKYGSVEVRGGYYGAKAGATAAVNIVSNLAAVRIDGGQFLMGVSSSAFGVRVASSSNVIVDGCLIDEADAYAVVVDTSTNCRIAPFVKNHSATCDAAVAVLNACSALQIAPTVSGAGSKVAVGVQVLATAITFTAALVGATSATLSAAFTGATGSYSVLFSDGSQRDVSFTNASASVTWTGAVTATANANYAALSRSEINGSGIDSTCILSGATNKITLAGYTVAATGTKGSNVISGVVA